MIPCEYPDILYLFTRNWRDCSTGCWKPHDHIFIRLDTIPERDGHTDGLTDGQTESLWLLQRSALRAMQTRCKIDLNAFNSIMLIAHGYMLICSPLQARPQRRTSAQSTWVYSNYRVIQILFFVFAQISSRQDKRLFQCGSQEAGWVKYDKYVKKCAVCLGYNKNTRYKIHNKQVAIWKIKCTIKYKLHTVLEVGQSIVKEGLIFFSSRVWYRVF